MKTDYHKILKDNCPILFIENVSFLKKFCKTKKAFCILLFIAIALFLYGIFYMIAKDSKNVNKILLARESKLNSEILKVNTQNEILTAETILLKNEIKSLSKKIETQKQKELAKYTTTTNITGPGLIITLKDNTSADAPEQSEKNIIHNSDLLKIVNFLWSENATAISINEERLSQNSHISCIGATILINQTRINNPFQIKAIGKKLSKEKVENALIVLSLLLRGIEINIEENENILIPAKK